MSDEMIAKSILDDTKATLEKVQSELAQYKAEEKNRQEQAQKDMASKHDLEINSLKAEIEANKEVAKAKDAKIADLEKDLAEAKQSLSNMVAEKAEAEKKAIQNNRLTSLLAKDVAKERAEELVTKFAEASNELFEELVKSLPDKKGDTEAKKVCDEDKKDKKKEKEEAEATKGLDKIEPVIDVDLNVGSGESVTIAEKAAAWLGNQILSSTAKLKDRGEE